MDKILKSASTVKIGKRFSNKRISLGLSLEEASKILFINEDYLNAIEKGDYSIFPSESFARAYFKKYSQYLKNSSAFKGAATAWIDIFCRFHESTSCETNTPPKLCPTRTIGFLVCLNNAFNSEFKICAPSLGHLVVSQRKK